MVEDVIEIESFDAHINAIVAHASHVAGVDIGFRIEAHTRYFIVGACLAIEEIYTYLRTVIRLQAGMGRLRA